MTLGVLSALLILGGGFSLLYTAKSQADHVQLGEERQIVSRLISQQLTTLATDIETEFTWDEAYEKLKDGRWREWADSNIGVAFQKASHHDLTLVVDGHNETIFGWRRGVAMSTAERGSLTWRCAPLIEKVRAEERKRSERRATAAGAAPSDEISASELIINDGDIYFVSAALVLPNTSAVALREEPAPVVVSARRMDNWFLRDVLSGMRISGASLTPAMGSPRPTAGAGSAEFSLNDGSGVQIGMIRWHPRLPGEQLLAMTAPWLAAAFLLLLGFGAAMVMRIDKVLRNLADAENGLEDTILELTVAIDQADAASVAKSQFLANMSHEIRTPLNAILGMAQVLAQEDLTASQEARVQTIQRAGEGLLAIVNDVLEFSKLEAGKVQIVTAPFSIVSLVRSVSELFAESARADGLALVESLPPEVGGLWSGDETRIRQILLNLMSNAIKFTDTGIVRLDVRPAADGIIFSVIDQGVGVPPDKTELLFKKFTQIDGSSTRQRGGTGLGLAICSELVGLMGGEIAVSSRVGIGSEFYFRLPLTRVAGASDGDLPGLTTALPADQLEPSAQCPRVLVAEDNPDNQFVLKSILGSLDLDITLAENGQQAVALFRVEDFDLVLMDIQMPEMNGIEATREIRGLEARSGRVRVPIVAISASATADQVNSYAMNGMDGFVAKPISIPVLLRAIEDALHGPEQSVSGYAPPRAAAGI